MAEAFQLVASGFTVAEVALRLYRNLSTFVERAKNADGTTTELAIKFGRLRKTLYSIHVTLAARRRQLEKRRPEPEEEDIWLNISEALDGWSKVLEDFKDEILSLNPRVQGSATLDWVDKTLLQLRLDRRAPILGRLEKAIETHMNELSLMLSCLDIFQHAEASSQLKTLVGQVEQLSSSVMNGVEVSHHSVMAVTTMTNCVNVAHAVVKKISSQKPDVGPSALPSRLDESVPEQTQDTEDWIGHQDEQIGYGGGRLAKRNSAETGLDGATAREGPSDGEGPEDDHDPGSGPNPGPHPDDDEDPDPDFDDSTPLEVLDPLIHNFQQHVGAEMQAKRFEEAEMLQRKAIDHARDRNTLYGKAYEIADMQRTLADILKNRGLWKEARQIRHDLLRGEPDTAFTRSRRSNARPQPSSSEKIMEDSTDYYELAHGYLMEYRDHEDVEMWDRCEKFARRSFMLRLMIRSDQEAEFLESVQFLVEAYEHRGCFVDAETYRNLYLKGSARARSRSLATSSNPTTSGHFQAVPPFPMPASFAIDAEDMNGTTPLIAAIIEGNAPKVAFFLQHGADVELRCRQGRTPLLHAVDHRNEELIIKLKAWGADVDARSGEMTVLHHAIAQGSSEIAKLLLDLHADIEAPNGEGLTPLLHAVGRGHLEMVDVLCKERPNLDARNEEGWTALHLAAKHRGIDIPRVLLGKGADVNARCNQGQTPLHFAASEGNEAFARLVLDGNSRWTADIEARDRVGRTPLYLAAKGSKYAVAELLLNKGAIIDLPKDLPYNIKQLMKDTAAQRLAPPSVASPGERRRSSDTRRLPERSFTSLFRPKSK